MLFSFSYLTNLQVVHLKLTLVHYLHVVFLSQNSAVFYISLAIGMALSGDHNDRGELRTHESLDELKTDLADYIADLSEMSVKERGVFAVALSGGSLIGLMGYLYFPFLMFVYLVFVLCGFMHLVCIFGGKWKAGNCVKLLMTRLLTGPSGISFGPTSVLWVRIMMIAIISWQRMAFYQRY